MATDGVLTGDDQSDATFVVDGHGPIARIATPTSGLTFVGAVVIALSGQGEDPEDGSLADAQLRWSSDRSGPLGTGRRLDVAASSLPEGSHVITLTATDGGGLTGTATVVITLSRSRLIASPTLAVHPKTVSLALAAPGSVVSPESLNVWNEGDGRLEWTATADASWIRLDASAGTAPATIHVGVDAGALAPGTYHGTVRVTGAAGVGGSVTVDVHLVVTSPPAFNAQPADLAVALRGTARFAAAASGAPEPVVRWQGRGGAGETWRTLADGGPYRGVGTPTLTLADVPGSLNGWQYRCVAENAIGTAISSDATLSVIVAFTDVPLQARGTTVKAIHIRELREAIDALRLRHGLSRYSWTDPALAPGLTVVRATHVMELRAALDSAYSAAGRSLPVYKSPAPVTGVTLVSTAHVAELRAAVLSLW